MLEHGPAFPQAVEFVLGDVDGDGDPDALAYEPPQMTLYRNDGAAGFTAGPPVPRGPAQTSDAAFGDVDVFFSNIKPFFGGPDELWVNDGTGSYALGSLPRPPPRATRRRSATSTAPGTTGRRLARAAATAAR